jgi:hypothetical protein
MQTKPSSNWTAASTFALLLLVSATALQGGGDVFRSLQLWSGFGFAATLVFGLVSGRGQSSVLSSIRPVVLVFGGFTILFVLTQFMGWVAPSLLLITELVSSVLLPVVSLMALLFAPADQRPLPGRGAAVLFAGFVMLAGFGTIANRHIQGGEPDSSKRTPKAPRHPKAAGLPAAV